MPVGVEPTFSGLSCPSALELVITAERIASAAAMLLNFINNLLEPLAGLVAPTRFGLNFILGNIVYTLR